MDADSAHVADDDAIIASYIAGVHKAARQLPRDRREWVIAQAAGRLADSLEAGGKDGRGAGAAMARLGDPAELVLAIDGHRPGVEARWMEFAAVLLVLAGGILWRPAWLIGVTLVWVSPRWRWPDKLLATLVWPGGLVAAGLLMARYTALGLFAGGGFGGIRLPGGGFIFGRGNAGPGSTPLRGGTSEGSFFARPNGSFQYLIDSTLGHPPLRHLLMLLAAAVPPVVVAIRLLRRARRPEQPQAPAALASPAASGPAAAAGPGA